MCVHYKYIYICLCNQKYKNISSKKTCVVYDGVLYMSLYINYIIKKTKTRPEEGAASTAPLAPHLGDLISDAAEVEVQLALRKTSNQDLG